MFRITNGVGFHITFQNGVTISVQFGAGNFRANRYESVNFGNVESPNAEVAIWNNKGEWITDLVAKKSS